MIRRNISLILCVVILHSSFSAQFEEKYLVAENTPQWAILMYTADPDPGLVVKAYNLYYTDHEFVKNQHTQYYKRWLRLFSRNNSKSGVLYGKIKILLYTER